MATLTLGGQYVLAEQIGFGGCGTVFHGTHRVAGKAVAIKVEPATERDVGSPLRQESRIYKSLSGGPGVPWIMWSGKQGDYNVIVIDRLGKDLDRLFRMCNRHFTLKTILMLADQLLSRLEYIHSRGLCHRDVKPANFVMGAGSTAGLVNVIDFGLARRFRDARTGEHVPYSQDDIHGTGTSLFASLNTHDGIECSRRDDLESLAYMLIYFMRGKLPWSHITGSTDDETWELIKAAKREVEPVLTVGLPSEFDALYRYARGLEFGDQPDYEGLRGLFKDLASRKRIEYDGRFDWAVRKPVGKRRFCAACAKKHDS